MSKKVSSTVRSTLCLSSTAVHSPTPCFVAWCLLLLLSGACCLLAALEIDGCSDAVDRRFGAVRRYTAAAAPIPSTTRESASRRGEGAVPPGAPLTESTLLGAGAGVGAPSSSSSEYEYEYEYENAYE